MANDRLPNGAFAGVQYAIGVLIDLNAPALDDDELREIMRAWYPIVHIARDRGERFAAIAGAPGARIAEFAATWSAEGALVDAMNQAHRKIGRPILWRACLGPEDEAALRRIFGNAGVLH